MASHDLGVALTGASGAPYGLRLLHVLLLAGKTIHLTISPAAVQVLIDRGANLNLRPTPGHNTPPMIWSAYNDAGDPTIARLLVERGVDIDATNDVGETALSYALKQGPDTALVR